LPRRFGRRLCNRIPCYEVHTIGAISDRFRTETGFLFQAQHTLSAAPELDTIIIAGGTGVLRADVTDKISTWILNRINDTRRIGAVGTGVRALAATGLLNGAIFTMRRNAGNFSPTAMTPTIKQTGCGQRPHPGADSTNSACVINTVQNPCTNFVGNICP